MPKKHKSAPSPVDRMRQDLYSRAPGLEALERLMEGADDLVFCIKNRNRQYLAANDTFLRLTGLTSRDQLLGRTAREVFPAPLAAGYEQQDDLVFRTGSEVRDRLETITHRDGSLGWYRADKVPVRDAAGNVIALAGISRDLHIPATGDPRLGSLAAVVEKIRRDYAQPLRIADLARRAGMSSSRLERLMKSVLRVSPRQLLTRQRVEAAAALLRSTSEALNDIALNCGFCDQPTFCRQFRKVTGLSPGAFRRLTTGRPAAGGA